MEFSHWLRDLRTKRDLNFAECAELTKVDASTLNRIENGHTQPTLLTVLRICQGLGTDLPSLMAEIRETPRRPTPDAPRWSRAYHVITEEDAAEFTDMLGGNPSRGLSILAQFVSDVAELLRSVPPRELNIVSDSMPVRVHAQANQKWLDRLPRSYGRDDLTRSLAEPHAAKVIVPYPEIFPGDHVRRIYDAGGAITFADAGIYLRSIRKGRNETLADLQHSTDISTSVLSRLESGDIERLKFIDALLLDGALSQEDVLISLFWSAANFHSRRTGRMDLDGQPIPMEDAILLFIHLCRWMQLLQPGNTGWAVDIRKRWR